ncbi:hypothetical protein M501DRAFT_932416 [Patellaria atrata CBS 101060]|uniref:Tat pathway signal sequence n=1 Tax=Patellaria atrata CBS 101060 TaxID=1346257 RepID=A0A9P4VNC7_9PEZI|nr:hypothetical protein M501DRAFT_932416 [Patellaria atrata CBS 101060]
MPSRIQYTPISDRSSSPTSINELKSEESEEYQNIQTSHSLFHWIAHVVSLLAIGILSIILVLSRGQIGRQCWERYNYYSPVNEALADRPYIENRFNGSLWYESPFKGPPSPAVEDAWHSIMQYGMIAVSASDMVRVNHTLRTAAQFPAEAGGGYIAATVGTHQLHCLHYIWQDHHRSYFPNVLKKVEEIPEMYERHYEHCVDYIRQSLMCNFDVGLVTYNWVRDHQNPTPNSNAMHKCVDWEHVQGWLKEKAVEVPEGFTWKQPEGQESLPFNP